MILAQNKKARFDYEILKEFEAGLSLSSQMVKELRAKKINLSSNFVIFQNGKLEIIGLGNNKLIENVPLLLNQKEALEIKDKIKTKGISGVVISIYTKNRWIKAKIGVARGKTDVDKRNTIKKRDLDRETRKGIL